MLAQKAGRRRVVFSLEKYRALVLVTAARLGGRPD
jgi:hypothetical protein